MGLSSLISENELTIMIIADHPVMGRGLKYLIEDEAVFALCGDAVNLIDAEQQDDICGINDAGIIYEKLPQIRINRNAINRGNK